MSLNDLNREYTPINANNDFADFSPSDFNHYIVYHGRE